MTSGKSNLVESIVGFIRSTYAFLGSDIKLQPKVDYHGHILTPDIVIYGGKGSESAPTVVVEARHRIDPLSIEELIKYLRATGARYGLVSDGLNHIYFYQEPPNHPIEIPYIPPENETKITFRKQVA